MSSQIGESYRDNMIALRGAPPAVSDDGFDAASRAVQVIAPVGAIKVAVERDDARIVQRLKVLAGAAGSKFYYRFPVKNKDGSSGNVEGPSIDCALAVARTYGNCDIDVRVTDEGEHWIFLARFRDFETGFTISRAFQQRKGQTTMKTKDPGRALDIVFQIGQSKAIRNVICNALGDLADFAFEEAKASFVDRIGKRVEYYRDRAVERLAEMKIDLKRVEAIIGRAAKDWMAPELARVIAELQGIQDGMALADETYPPLAIAADAKPAPEEPKREERARPEAPAAETKPAQSEGFDIEAYVENCEREVKSINALGDLAEFDGTVTTMLKDNGAAGEVVRYWRTVVMTRQTELTKRAK